MSAQIEQENLWNKILNESQNESKYRNKNLLVIGNKNAGKRTFINKLYETSNTVFPFKQNEIQFQQLGISGITSALDYTYLNIKNLDDPDNEIKAKLNVFIMDEVEQKNLLDILMNKEFLQNTCIVLMLDLSQPWCFIKFLNEWMDILTQKLSQIQIPLEQLDNLRNSIETHIKSYKEPEFDEEGKLIKNTLDQQQINLIPLQEGVLKVNTAIPIQILLSKSDLIQNYEKEKDGDQKIQFLQYSLRNYSITYGASLFYTSAKNDTNIQLFYEYILCRFYDFEQKNKADVITKDSLFIPSGYDNLNIIQKSFSTLNSKIFYEDLFIAPDKKKNQVNKEEIVADENQAFFQKIKDKQGANQGKMSQNKTQFVGQTNQNTSDVLKNFYSNLKNTPSTAQQKVEIDSKQLREAAEQEILNRLGSKFNMSSIKNQDSKNITQQKDSERIMNLIKKTSTKE